MNRRLRNGSIIVAMLLLLLLLIVGCGIPGDPVPDDWYTRNVYPGIHNTYDIGTAILAYRNGYFTNLFVGGVPVVGGAEADPIFTASDVFGVTAADIAGWTNHPPLTTGTHGVAGTIVGTSDVQSLTNKQLTMNNGDYIYWKNGAGVPQAILALTGAGFHIIDPTNVGVYLNYNTLGSVYLWGYDQGTGENLVLYGSYATAISTLKDSPTLDMAAFYWDGASAGWEYKILHDMITAGAAPKSQAVHSINGINILRLENNNGTVKTYSDGAFQTGGVANYALFAADGTMTLVGTATVEREVEIPLTAFGKGAAAPATVYIGNYIGYEYTINDTVYYSMEVPSDWDSTSDLQIEFHWYIDEAYATAPNGEVRWNLIYTATKEDGTEAVDAATATIDSGDINIPATAKYLVETRLAIPAASLQAHDIIGVQVKRVALVAGNNPTAKPTLIGAMIEYISNKLGE